MDDVMLGLSLWLNIAVLVPVCAGLLRKAKWAERAWGGESAARGILLAVYLAILAGSIVLLFIQSPALAAPLLALQVLYKLITPFTVGTLRNPVVLSNLGIAAFHIATLSLIWPALPLG